MRDYPDSARSQACLGGDGLLVFSAVTPLLGAREQLSSCHGQPLPNPFLLYPSNATGRQAVSCPDVPDWSSAEQYNMPADASRLSKKHVVESQADNRTPLTAQTGMRDRIVCAVFIFFFCFSLLKIFMTVSSTCHWELPVAEGEKLCSSVTFDRGNPASYTTCPATAAASASPCCSLVVEAWKFLCWGCALGTNLLQSVG